MKQKKTRAAALAALLLATLGLQAQTPAAEVVAHEIEAQEERRVRIGVRAGLNMARLADDKAFAPAEGKNQAGWHVGAVVDVPLRAGFYLQPGLYLSAKGAKTESYRHTLSDGLQLQLQTGPYLAYGLGGKTSTEWERMEIVTGGFSFRSSGTTETDTFGHDAEAQDPKDRGAGIKRFDMGWNLGAGLAFARFYVGLAYEWGFLNLCEAGAWDEGASLRTRNLRISVGYNF